MKLLNVLSGIALLGFLFFSASRSSAQITVYNNTCYSMFVTAQWTATAFSCSKCTGCNSSGVVASGTGSIPGSGPDIGAGEAFMHATAGLNVYTCTQYNQAIMDCTYDAYSGTSTCCVTEWIVYWVDHELFIDNY